VKVIVVETTGLSAAERINVRLAHRLIPRNADLRTTIEGFESFGRSKR
jgi:hypothetical protein